MPTFEEEREALRQSIRLEIRSEVIQESTPDFYKVENRVFTCVGDRVFIGGEEVKSDIRGRLRDEARYIQRSTFWEIFNATITDKAAKIALVNSQEWEHVLSAKQLLNWGTVFRNSIRILMK